MFRYAKMFKQTSQSAPIPGSKQEKNSAGGYSFKADDWTRLDRFLILGTEKGSYYANEHTLTVDNAGVVLRCIEDDGLRTVERIRSISLAGRAPKNDPAIFALAMCLKAGELETRRAAAAAVPDVCRIGTHIFQLADAINALGGWGRLTTKAVAGYYQAKSAERLALDLFKYKSRGGWSHKDLLLKAHVGKYDQDVEHQALFRHVVAGDEKKVRKVRRTDKDGRVRSEGVYASVADVKLPRLVEGVRLAQEARRPKQSAKLIREYGLPREVIQTEHLNDVKVWEALLMSNKGMPMTAMLRNLGKMQSIGLLDPLSDASKYVVNKLGDVEALKRARVHPMSVLMAQRTYAQGHGVKGKLSWKANAAITSALENAFYASFDAVEPTGKNWLLALDVSGSMSARIAGTSISAAEASAAMSLVTMYAEKWTHTMCFASGGDAITGGKSNYGWGTAIRDLKFVKGMTLQQAMSTASKHNFGGTDCALPMIAAMKRKLPVDVFVVYTDSETWAGNIHPVQVLREYRQKMGRDAKLVVMGMCSNGFTIADPDDAGMLDVVGFDTATPQILADFARGALK